jgi:hypothetical protein
VPHAVELPPFEGRQRLLDGEAAKPQDAALDFVERLVSPTCQQYASFLRRVCGFMARSRSHATSSCGVPIIAFDRRKVLQERCQIFRTHDRAAAVSSGNQRPRFNGLVNCGPPETS